MEVLMEQVLVEAEKETAIFAVSSFPFTKGR
jgi:hypothetical protein